MIKTLFIFTALFLSGSLSAKSPSILFCLSDDQSYAHIGANRDPVGHNGSTFSDTPNIDHLAAEGVWFTDGCATALFGE